MKAKVTNNKKGISLIVLIITIIVMIILAGAVILTLGNTNIFDRAQEAVDKTNLSEVQQIASIAWAEAYMEGAKTKEEFEEAITERLKDIDTSKYYIKVTTSGVEVSMLGPWTQDGTTVTDGVITLNVGDYINYVATGSDYTGTWQVLGAENGELLILSTDYVKEEFELGSSTSLAEAQSDYITGVTQLNKACEPYGNGAKASGARSITVEDIDRVAEYDPTTSNPEDWEATPVTSYMNEVTFYWNGTDYPVYKSAKESSNLTSIHNKFIWYDAASNSWKQATNPGNTISTETQIVAEDGTVAKITSDFYVYLGEAEIDPTSAAYELLFANSEGNLEYWLASPFSNVDYLDAFFGMRAVYDGVMSGWCFAGSYGYDNGEALGVLAVVSLESDIQLDAGTEANSWIIVNGN